MLKQKKESKMILRKYKSKRNIEMIGGLFLGVILLLCSLFILNSKFQIWNTKVAFANPDWLSGWTYRKPITITDNSGNDLTDYQIQLTIDTASLISSNKLQSECQDIRFTKDDGTTKIPYWIESGCNTSETKIWVKVPSIPANSDVTIYMYYGNPNASSESNGDNVFEFFDDATGTYSDKWVNIEGTGSYSIVEGKQAISLDSATTNIRTKDYQNTGAMIIEADLYATEVITAIQYYQDSTPSTNEHYHARIDVRSGEKEAIVKDSGFSGSETDVFSDSNTWVSCKLIRDGNGDHKWYVGGSLADQRSSDTTYTSGYLALNHHNSGTGAVANLRVRKYASPEPTYTLGSEEESGVISVTTNDATNAQDTTATLNGTLNYLGENPEVLVWFEWGETDSYGNTTTKETKSQTGTFSANLSGLTKGTTYHFKACASKTDDTGQVCGEDKTFKTVPWWNENWSYRKKITISNSGSELKNYQLNGDCTHISYNEHMNSDFSDIRFVDPDSPFVENSSDDWTSADKSNVTINTDNITLQYIPGDVSYDFEDGEQGWTHGVYDGSRDWSRTTSICGTNLGTNAMVNEHCSTYAHNWLKSPILDLSSATSPSLSLKVWQSDEDGGCYGEGMYDQKDLRICQDDGAGGVTNCTTLACSWTNDGTWNTYNYDISSYAGKNNVVLMLRIQLLL